MPETTCFIFVERDVDKRNKLYKAVSSLGYAANCGGRRMMMRWIAGLLRAEGRGMSESTMRHFMERIDTDMENIRRELEKLVFYTDGRTEIYPEDIDAVCTVHAESQVFDMVKAVADKQQARALELYYDLIALKEPPMRILYWIARQFNQLYQMKELTGKGYPDHVVRNGWESGTFIVRKIKLCAITSHWKNCAER